jgi:hypothetical protein
MRDDDDLRALRGLSDEARERWQQVRMQAGLRLVENHQVRQTR